MAAAVVSTSSAPLPTVDEVRGLYAAATAEPPLHEGPASAELYASVYEAARRTEEITVATVREDRRLLAFAYGHPWEWAEQRYPWADHLRTRLGTAAEQLDGTVSLALLARAPRARRRGLGRAVLCSWLEATGDRPCWLATTDRETPARRLYTSLGFTAIGHGPAAPDGNPALILLRTATVAVPHR